MTIDFEKDQREDLDGANDANKLSDQVVKLQELEAELLVKEQELKEVKRKVELVSSEVIPTMMQEMNISTLKLADGTSVEVKPVYGAISHDFSLHDLKHSTCLLLELFMLC